MFILANLFEVLLEVHPTPCNRLITTQHILRFQKYNTILPCLFCSCVPKRAPEDSTELLALITGATYTCLCWEFTGMVSKIVRNSNFAANTLSQSVDATSYLLYIARGYLCVCV